MQWTELFTVSIEAQWALGYSSQRVDRLNHVEDRQVAGRSSEREAAMWAALGVYQLGLCEPVQNLGQVSNRYACRLCDLLRGLWLIGAAGYVDYRTQAIFGSL